MFISYSHNLEDVMIWRALSKSNIKNGFYVDVGANDPVTASVTKAFYDRGYRGINIEPIRKHFVQLQKQRPRDINLQVAASNTNGLAHFYENEADELSTLIGDLGQSYKATYNIKEYDVPTRKLTDICMEHQAAELHFLKIDVEGAEKAVLEGLDLTIIRPWIILSEADKSGDSSYQLWEPKLVANDYHFIYSDGSNRFYIADEHQELDKYFEWPPNKSDRFTFSFKRLFILKLKEEDPDSISLTALQRILLSRILMRSTIFAWKFNRLFRGLGFNIPEYLIHSKERRFSR